MDVVSIRIKPKSAGEKWVYSAYSSTAQSVTEGSQGRKSNRAGTWWRGGGGR